MSSTAAPCRAIDDGAAWNLRRQVHLQNLVDVGELLAGRGLHDHKLQVGAAGATIKNRQVNAGPFAEVAKNVLPHVRLGGGG